MADETATKEKKVVETPKKQEDAQAPESGANENKSQANDTQSTKRTRTKNKRTRSTRRPQRAKSEFAQNVLDIRRVTRVMAGGRRFSFSATMAIGNKKGAVGVGVGKANDTALAIEKAIRVAKKNMISVPLTKEGTIPHEVETKYSSARIMLFPAPGKGLTAGGAVRTVLELLGARDVGGKILSRSKNAINNARATIKALKQIEGTKAYVPKEPKVMKKGPGKAGGRRGPRRTESQKK